MPVPARLAVALGLLAVASPARYEPGGRAVAPPVERIVANQNRVPAGRLRNGTLTLAPRASHRHVPSLRRRRRRRRGAGVRRSRTPAPDPGPPDSGARGHRHRGHGPEHAPRLDPRAARARDATRRPRPTRFRSAARRDPDGALHGRPPGTYFYWGTHDRRSRWTTTGGSTASSTARFIVDPAGRARARRAGLRHGPLAPAGRHRGAGPGAARSW